MAGNPLVAQGTVNRIRGSLVIPNFPQLNVTAPFLGKEGIRLTFQGETTLYIPTMTGAATSPEPYLQVMIEVDLLKTQNLSSLYKAQQELLATIGAATLYPDTSSLPIYNFVNCAIQKTGDLNFAGTTAAYPITIGGLYNINSSLFNMN